VRCLLLRTANGGLVIREVLSISRNALKPEVAILEDIDQVKTGAERKTLYLG
jgi:hypothetical protein